MSETDLFIFQKEDFRDFRQWLNLDIENITWQGRFSKEFDTFWEIFFLEGLSLEQVYERIEYAKKRVKIGPIHTWFNWLFDKLIFYVFTHKDLSIRDISWQANITESKVAYVLRNFFIDCFPHLDDFFSSRFQVGNVLSNNIFVKFTDIKNEIGLDKDVVLKNHDEDLMSALEITLYQEWRDLLKKMEKDLFNRKVDLSKLKEKASFGRQIRFLQEVFLLFFIGGLIVFGVIKLNKWYEVNLAEKISIFEPDFLWLSKSLSFKEAVDPEKEAQMANEIKKLQAVADQRLNTLPTFDEERMDTESEVVLTSVEDIPSDISVVAPGQSAYEEQVNQNWFYRDSAFGKKKAFRLMLKSTDTLAMSKILNPLLSQFKVEQVDKVRPGTFVPGGVYYNLFVPSSSLKDFLAKVMNVGEATLYESRTKTGNKSGMNKVFIWVKEI